MKKINWKSKTLLPIVLIAVVLVAVVLVLIASVILKKDDEDIRKKSGKQTSVFINDPYKNATKITNSKLAKEHCVNDICVKDLVIYYTDTVNNIEFDLINKGKEKATGYLKVVFGDKEMTVSYDALESKRPSPYTIQLGKEKLATTEDFSVRELTSEELAKFKK